MLILFYFNTNTGAPAENSLSGEGGKEGGMGGNGESGGRGEREEGDKGEKGKTREECGQNIFIDVLI